MIPRTVSTVLKTILDWLLAGWNVIRMPGRSHRGPLPPADDELAQQATDLRHHVTQLAEEIGDRNVLHRPRELAQTADYIEAEFAGVGYRVKRQECEVSGNVCCNLEVEVPGTSRPDEIVIIGAHYDSVPGSPAANDNASGVAAILVLAGRFRGRPIDRTLRFVAFVNEEKPFAHTEQMGSWVYARRCRQRNEKITAMLSLETIGYYSELADSQNYPPPVGLIYPSTGNFIAFVGNTRYGRLVRQVVAAFRQHEPFPSEGGALPKAIPNIGFSDHWSFWQEGYPALMVTDTAPFRYPHYHTPEDTADKIDFDRMARVVRGLDKVLLTLVGSGTRKAIRVRDFQPGDTETFRRLNEEWITRYFSIEEKDRELFDDPEGQIIAKGGVILIMESDGEPVGCCALINKDTDTFEVAKMAVTKVQQGKGLGRILLQTCIERARALGKKRMSLETNSKLEAAISLYRSFGFVEQSAGAWPPSEYARVDLVMELML